MKRPYGDYIEIDEDFDPKDVPKIFEQIYIPLIASIKISNGEPDLDSLRVIIKQRKPADSPFLVKSTFAVRIDAEFEEHEPFKYREVET